MRAEREERDRQLLLPRLFTQRSPQQACRRRKAPPPMSPTPLPSQLSLSPPFECGPGLWQANIDLDNIELSAGNQLLVHRKVA